MSSFLNYKYYSIMIKNISYKLVLLFFISCSSGGDDPTPDDPPPVVKYRLTTSANPSDGGTVTPSSGEYNKGASVTVVATASDGYEFQDWTGATGTNPSITIVMNSNKTLTANFSEKQDIDGTVWTGTNITFTKSNNANPNEAANQDRLTDNVWITRGNSKEIYNAAKESVASKNNSPSGTKWAVGTLDQIQSLTFKNFRAAVGSPKNVVGKNLVMFMEEDKIYVSVKFSSWQSGSGNNQGGGGGFSYSRSTKP